MQPYSDKLKDFINKVHWTYAKTMPDWPHEYIVRDKVDGTLFVEMVKHIREFGNDGLFYQTHLIYFDADGLVYWTMGAPIDETIIINRCKGEYTYEARLKAGTLPTTKHT